MKDLIIYLILVFLIACSGKSDSILSTPVQKDAGSLIILNNSGFLGATVAGTSIDYILTLKANGGLTLSDLEASITTHDPISFKDDLYPGTGGSCHTTLNSGDTCTIILSYAPENTASHIASIQFKYRDSLKSYQKNFQVSADSHPILSFEYGTSYDFGNKFVGSSTNLRIRITNSGKVTAQNISINNLSLPFSMRGGSYPGTGGSCGPSLSPGQTCDLYVNYSPTNNGEHLQDINLHYLNTGRPESNTLNLMAWGFREAQLTFSDPLGFNFGTVAAALNHDKTFTITHAAGDVTATSLDLLGLSSPFNFKGGNFPGTGGTCTRTLSKEKGSCSVVVTLSAAASGSWSNSLNFSYFNGKETITTASSLAATTRQRAQLSITPTNYLFGVTQVLSENSHLFTVSYQSGELPATTLGFTALPGHLIYSGGSFPGSGGSCSSILSSGSCTIALSYSPQTYGSHTLNTAFSYHDGTSAKLIPLTLSGKTNSTLLSNSSMSFGNVVNGMSKVLNITLSTSAGNGITDLQVNSLSAPFTFNGGSFPGSGGTCNSVRSASTNCTLSLVYTPQTEGLHNGVLSLTYNGGTGVKTHSISLVGNATPAAHITISDTDFTSTSVNSVKEMMVTITNSSSMTPTAANWTFPTGFSFKNGNFPGTGGNCWSNSCRLVVLFQPTEAKSYSGPLTVTYNDGTGNIKTTSATLSGIGVPTNDLFISNFDTVNYSSLHVGNTRDIIFTLSHGAGSTAASITHKTAANSTDYLITNDSCPLTLNHGASCSFTVRYAPQTAGTKSSSFSVGYTSDSAKTVTRLITGSAILPALITPSPSSLDFGSRPTDQTYEWELTFTHSGAANANSFTRSLSGNGFSKTADTCTTTLSSGSSCKVTLRFTPTANINYTGNFIYSYHNGFKSETVSIPLVGVGAATAVLNFSASTYDFGKIIQTQSSSRIITISHSGPTAASNLSTNTLSDPFAFQGGSFPGTGGSCGDTLVSGSCTLVIDFVPSSVGIKNQSLTMSYHNGSVSRSKTTLMTGEALAQAIISISEANPYNFGTTNLTGFIDKSFTLSNSGSVTGTSIEGSFDLDVFNFKGGSYPGIGGNCAENLASGQNCTIVLSFTPLQLINYNGIFTLNYHDGLRTQTEMKNLQGVGGSSFRSEDYLFTLSEAHVFTAAEVFIENSDFTAMISDSEIVIYDPEKKIIFQERNHLAPLREGLFIKKLIEDLNHDGIADYLFSIQDLQGSIHGYSIRCGKSFKILERFINR